MLIPNERGLERALEMRDRFDEISVFLSASETHNRSNVNRSVDESLAGLERRAGDGPEAGLRCEGVIATSFGCPYEGEVPAERVLEIAERLAAAGCEEVGFGDTTGMANPRQVRRVLRRRPRAAARRRADRPLPQHPRPGPRQRPRGARGGRDSFESSFGELGGCPVPPGSTGNVSTEDVVSMLHEMGIETGVDLPRADRGLAGRSGGPRPPAGCPRAAGRPGGLAPGGVGSRPCAATPSGPPPRPRTSPRSRSCSRRDVVFRSPVVFKPYEGLEALKLLLGNVVEVFEDFRYLDQVESGDAAVLVFEARVGDRQLHGVDVLRFGEEGLITEMMVMVRPLSGLQAVAEAMA